MTDTAQLSGPELVAVIAEKVMGWESQEIDHHAPEIRWWKTQTGDMVETFGGTPDSFQPHFSRDDLAEALAALPEEKRIEFTRRVALKSPVGGGLLGERWFLLTAPPETVCRAIVEVMT